MKEPEYEIGDIVSLEEKELPPEKGGGERFLIFLKALLRKRDLRLALLESSDAIANAERFHMFMRRFSEDEIAAIEKDESGSAIYIINSGGSFADGYKEEKLKLVRRGNVWKYKHGEALSFDGLYPLLEEFKLHIDLEKYTRGKIFKAYSYTEVARLAIAGELDWYLLERVSDDLRDGEQFVAVKMEDADLGVRLREFAIKEYGGNIKNEEFKCEIAEGNYVRGESFALNDIKGIVGAAKDGRLDWVLKEDFGGEEVYVAIKMKNPVIGAWARQVMIDAHRGEYDES